MKAARLHERGGHPLSIDVIDKPTPSPGDVLIEVKACGIVPNMRNVIHHPAEVAGLKLLDLPAIYGLDAAGVVAEVGSRVRGVEVGQRVYVNPARYCGNCLACRKGRTWACEYSALNGYWGTGPKSHQTAADYPSGGFAEFMTAPPYSLVHLPDTVSFEVAARWGYLGTAYAGLRRANVDMTTSVLINGASGTLGLGATLFALALGTPLVLGVGRNAERLEKVREIAPDRIHVMSTEGGGSVAEWARSLTGGIGPDVVLDALPTFSPAESFQAAAAALARGGTHVNVGGVIEPVAYSPIAVMNDDQTFAGQAWFTPQQGQEMADLAAAGVVRLDVFEHEVFPLEKINEAFDVIEQRDGGFSNVVILPGSD